MDAVRYLGDEVISSSSGEERYPRPNLKHGALFYRW